jgi:hypothetical protein
MTRKKRQLKKEHDSIYREAVHESKTTICPECGVPYSEDEHHMLIYDDDEDGMGITYSTCRPAKYRC